MTNTKPQASFRKHQLKLIGKEKKELELLHSNSRNPKTKEKITLKKLGKNPLYL